MVCRKELYSRYNYQPSACKYRLVVAVLEAVHPLLNFSTRLSDTLFMVCRRRLLRWRTLFAVCV